MAIESTFILFKVPSNHHGASIMFGAISDSLNSHLLEYRTRLVRLSEEDLFQIYGHLPENILIATFARLAQIDAHLFMVCGEAAISNVNRLKGTKTDPSQCEPGTWRREFATLFGHRAVKLYNCAGKTTATVHDNFIHTPATEEIDIHRAVLTHFFLE